MMTVDEYVSEYKDALDRFQQYWIEQNRTNPETFPLELDEDNRGLWSEMFEFFLNTEKE